MEHEAQSHSDEQTGGPLPSAEALLVALVFAPTTFSRNKFFALYEDAALRQARRRAQMVRSLVKELTEPWPLAGEIPAHPAAVDISDPRPLEASERGDDDPRGEPLFVLSFTVPELGYRREARLTQLELAALRYCLARAQRTIVSEADKKLVETYLARLAPLASPAND